MTTTYTHDNGVTIRRLPNGTFEGTHDDWREIHRSFDGLHWITDEGASGILTGMLRAAWYGWAAQGAEPGEEPEAYTGPVSEMPDGVWEEIDATSRLLLVVSNGIGYWRTIGDPEDSWDAVIEDVEGFARIGDFDPSLLFRGGCRMTTRDTSTAAAKQYAKRLRDGQEGDGEEALDLRGYGELGEAASLLESLAAERDQTFTLIRQWVRETMDARNERDAARAEAERLRGGMREILYLTTYGGGLAIQEKVHALLYPEDQPTPPPGDTQSGEEASDV